ncbi:hypothetical protein [Pacificoceanicola onchidii]|uniref:hypothetical protein n=1 Tax=Pacificoceanicola onchidii TaxID=2562685 RepID=UPI0010A555E3|nr:hypothetical protein [Pacificoceanicola onchidii]
MRTHTHLHRTAWLGFLIGTALMALAQMASAQTSLSSTDSYISDELCVGSACDGSEAYGDDTLTIKHARPVLLFKDSSSSAVFPDRSWSIQIGQSSTEEFGLYDETATTTPFQIEGGAPESTFYMTSNGDLGLGTSIPAADLHIVEPTVTRAVLRLETATGNAAYDETFDLSVDATWMAFSNPNGPSYPLQVHVDAPSNAFVVRSSGDVGMGVIGASDALHVQRTDGTAGITVENTAASGQAVREMFRMVNEGGSYFTLANTTTSNEWYFVHENNTQGRFMINHSDGGIQMGLTKTGDLTLMGELFTAGSCSAGCDRVFDEDYPLPTIAEQSAMMKANRHLPNVGPTPEDGPFNITAMTGGMLNELEKAHLYIAELHEQNAKQANEIADLRAQLAALPGIVARLEVLESR